MAIEKTLWYGRRFGVEYGSEEILERLIAPKIYKEADILAKIERGSIENNNFQEKMFLADRLVKRLSKRFKSILFVGVTGSVAAGNPTKDSDIDLMIVTKSDRLWLTRLMLRAYIFFNKIPHRRYGQKEKKDDFCFNLWLEEDCLKLPKNKRHLKNAMDLILMKVVLNKNNTYEKLIAENDWAKKYVATGYEKRNKINDLRFMNKTKKVNLYIKILNWLAYHLQYWYMRSRISSELVDQKRAFFHPKGTK